MTRIFVSYSRVDKRFTEELVRHLRRTYGLANVWYDDELHGGVRWWQEILKQIAECDVFLYLLSNESVTSSYCQAEFTEARRLQKPIVTIQVRDRTRLSDELGEIQYVDMKHGIDSESFARLSGSINIMQGQAKKKRALWTPQTPLPTMPSHENSSVENRPDVDTPTLKIEVPPSSTNEHKNLANVTIKAALITGILGILGVILAITLPKMLDLSETVTPQFKPTTTVAQALDMPSVTETPTLSGFDTLQTAQAEFTQAVNTQVAFEKTATEQFIADSQATLNMERILATETSAYATLFALSPTPTMPSDLAVITRENTSQVVLIGEIAKDWTTDLAYRPDGQHFAISTISGVYIYSVADNTLFMELHEHTLGVPSVVYSPDGNHIVSGSQDGTVRIWDADSGETLAVLQGHGWRLSSVSYRPDASEIMVGEPHQIKVWDAQTNTLRFTWAVPVGVGSDFIYSPDGKNIASGAEDGSIWLFGELGWERLTEGGQTGYIRQIVYSPDGNQIAAADATIRIWDAKNGEQRLVLSGHTDYVNALSYNLDGSLLVSGSEDNTVRIWDAETGQQLLVLEGHSNKVHTVAFSPDGRRILSASEDGTIRIWGIPN